MERNEWTPAAVERFWNHFAQNPPAEGYFGATFGHGISNLLLSVGAAGRILDLGCGPGYLSHHLLDAGFFVSGVDQSPTSVEAANARCGSHPRWMGASASTAGHAEACVDAIACIETIEHLDDAALAAMLAEVQRLLRVGGVALFTTPNDEDLDLSMTYCPFCDSEFHSVQHVRSWTAASLADTLTSAGMSPVIVDTTDLSWWMPFRESQWLGLRRSAAGLAEHVRRRRRRFADGPHLVAVAQRR